MSHQVAPQHPAVVLRSRFVHLRALLAVAMLAVVGLTATVVILANDEADQSGSPSAEKSGLTQQGKRWSAYDKAISAMTPRELAAAFGTASVAPGTRYDGGPDEGTRGPQTAPASPASPGARYDGGPEEGTRGPQTAPASPSARYDGGPEEGTRGIVPAQPPTERYDGGPEEGTALSGARP
jgi:hypothetical protein